MSANRPQEARRSFVIDSPDGLHLRFAARLADTAGRYRSTVILLRDGVAGNAKSLLGIVSIGADVGMEVTVVARGRDAEAALAAITELFESGFEG